MSGPSLVNLKLGIHANFCFDGHVEALHAAELVLSAVNRLSRTKLSTEALKQHLSILARRLDGWSLSDIARNANADPQRLQITPAYVKEAGLATLDFGTMTLSVDILNAANELGLTKWPGPVIEVMRVSGRETKGFIDVMAETFDATECEWLFGGVGAFTETYAAMALEAEESKKDVPSPRAFLWPLTGIAGLSRARELDELPVFRVVDCKRGLLVQVFEDLWTGYADRYSRAAELLGLRSLWL